MRKIRIFDTTLRDGEQSPGCSMDLYEKLEVARALEALGVDVIEAGFPVSSEGDFAAVSRIAADIRGCSVTGLARALTGDIDAVWAAVRNGVSPLIHIFLADVYKRQVLGRLGLLNGRRATCFPGFEEHLAGAEKCGEPVVTDGNIVTAAGAGVAAEFGFAVGALLKDEVSAAFVRRSMQFAAEK